MLLPSHTSSGYFFYRVVLNVPYVGILNGISLFIILGIGVDGRLFGQIVLKTKISSSFSTFSFKERALRIWNSDWHGLSAKQLLQHFVRKGIAFIDPFSDISNYCSCFCSKSYISGRLRVLF